MSASVRTSLDRMTIADAMQWRFLQAYVGRAVSVSAIGTELRIRFNTDTEAEQMAKFIKGEPSVTDSLPALAGGK